MRLNASRRSSPRRTSAHPASTGTPSHLCGSRVSESARSMPRKRCRDRRVEHAERAVGAVDVEPEALRGRDVGERVERVDHASVDGAGRADEQRRHGAARAIRGDRGAQRGRVEPASGRAAPRASPRCRGRAAPARAARSYGPRPARRRRAAGRRRGRRDARRGRRPPARDRERRRGRRSSRRTRRS